MSDTYGDYGGGSDTSASEVMFGSGPAEAIYDQPEPEYDEYLDDRGGGEEYDELGELPPDLESMVAEAMRNGASSTEAMLEARQRADAWWQEYSARTEYEQYVAQRQALEEANAEARDLQAEAAERHGVPEHWVSSGTLHAVANDLLVRDQQAAYNGGDLERLEWLRSPAGAEAAIEEAARQARLADFGALAHKGLGQHPESEARKRAEFDAFARRTGLVSVRGVG